MLFDMTVIVSSSHCLLVCTYTIIIITSIANKNQDDISTSSGSSSGTSVTDTKPKVRILQRNAGKYGTHLDQHSLFLVPPPYSLVLLRM